MTPEEKEVAKQERKLKARPFSKMKSQYNLKKKRRTIKDATS